MMGINSNVENIERQIQNYCTPLEIECQNPNVKNYYEAL